MKQNIKVAKELIKLAKSLVANDNQYELQMWNDISIMCNNPYTNIGSYDASSSTMKLKLNFLIRFSFADADIANSSDQKFEEISELYQNKYESQVKSLLNKIIDDIQKINGVKNVKQGIKLYKGNQWDLNLQDIYDTTGFCCVLDIQTLQIQNVPTYKKFTQELMHLLKNKYKAEQCLF